jgi:hypothetical protein
MLNLLIGASGFLLALFTSPFVFAQPTPTVQPAGGLNLTLPIRCQLGETCWIVNYFDVDRSSAARDFQCRNRTYEGHTGTDFAVRDLRDVERGIPVIASADGVVLGMRDGEPDGVYLTDKATVANKECGNGVTLGHTNGWQTQYCHMRRGSVVVKVGDRIARGAHLGMVGLSGAAEFPHVHLEVRLNGKRLDPFTGKEASTSCDPRATAGTLWSPATKIENQEFAIFAAGFSATPLADGMLVRNADGEKALTATVPQIHFWAAAYGTETGDKVSLRIVAPNGQTVEKKGVIERAMARYTPSMAISPSAGRPWPPGSYRGIITIDRERGAGGNPVQKMREAAVEIR